MQRTTPRGFQMLLAALLAASAAPAAAQTAVERTYDSWLVRCETARGVNRCRMIQNISQKEGGQRLLTVVIARAEGEPQPLAQFQAPLGVYLPPGLTLQVDDGATLRAPFDQCTRGGCQARLRLTPEFVAQMKSGKVVKYGFQSPERKDVMIPAPLQGFTKALEELK